MLEDLITTETTIPVDPAITELAHIVKNKMHNPDGVVAILLYGSGLWQKNVQDCIWDLYVIVDAYKDVEPNIGLRIGGALLPPNVYFTETPLSCKYTIMRKDQFEHGASDKAVKPQIWARFAQPCRILYTRNEDAQNFIIQALTSCVLTFHKRALPFADSKTNPKDIWTSGLNETYGSELRSENPERAAQIYASAAASYDARTKLALGSIDFKLPVLFWVRRFFRRPFIKFLYFVQLMKAVFTFQNSVDYALWKIKRHSGVDIKANDFQRRYPLIGAWPLLWKVYRAGGLR